VLKRIDAILAPRNRKVEDLSANVGSRYPQRDEMNAAWTAWPIPAICRARHGRGEAADPRMLVENHGDLRQVGAGISPESRRDDDEERNSSRRPISMETVPYPGLKS